MKRHILILTIIGVVSTLIVTTNAFGDITVKRTQRLQRIADAEKSGLFAVSKKHDFTKIEPNAKFKQGELIVRFANKTSGEHPNRTEKEQILRTAGGGSIKKEFDALPSIGVIELSKGMTVEKALQKFNGNKGILYAQPNYKVEISSIIPNDPFFGQLWGMHNTGQDGGKVDADIDALEAWDSTTGSRDVIVAVIDTGVDYTHQDLAVNIWTNPGEIPGNGIDDDGNGYIDDIHGWDFYNYDNDPMDDNAHGTHVSGTIGAVGNNGIGVAGVCWNVRIMALKFLGSDGGGWTSDAISCIEYSVLMGADVSNNSWRGYGYSQALKDAIDAAGAAGMLFVAAAGNETNDNDGAFSSYPASYDSDCIISVAATDRYDNMSGFSNFGLRSVDLGAPGSEILSCVPGNDYQSWYGTSMAAPHVAGACALLWSLDPSMSSERVKDIILKSVDPIPALSGRCVSGGRLNVFNAVSSVFSGSGTAEDPYQISTANQLNGVGVNRVLLSKHFKLVADIDMSYFTGTQFHKIGNDAVHFTGGFDGNGYRISNFAYTSLASGEYVGLFGYIGDDGEVNDVYLTGVNINVENGDYVGGLAGYSSGTIKNCYAATVSENGISGGDFVGGLVGVNEGTIINSNTTAGVSGTDYVGGLAGFNDGSITGSHVAGYVAGWSYVGGLVGDSFMGEIIRCSSTADVWGDCYIGGFIGLNDNGTITDCYARGLVAGNSNVGGLAGMNHNGGRITNCYSSESVAMATSNKGGLVGYDYQAYYTKCFWEEMGGDPDINGIGNRSDPNVIRKSTADMKKKDTFKNAGWDFTNVWMINEGVDYPVLIGQKYGGGAGTAENPYLIYTAEDMNAIGSDSNDWDKCFRLMADIDLSGYTGTEFKTIGNGDKPFDGIFYGCDHDDIYGHYYTISNFTCISSSVNYAGLFGVIGTKGTVRNLAVEDVYVITGGYYAGGLAGVNYGTIRNCSTTGFIYAAGYAGGLVGYNYQGIIENCYSKTDVWGDSIVGGLVGFGNRGAITNCYSVGSVFAFSGYEGGLVAKKYMGVFQNSFWDTDTSGQSTSAGGTGKTTAQMMRRSTFTGWDFTNIWVIEENFKYPQFRWQKYSGGKGTAENPYLIYTPGDMVSVGIQDEDWFEYFMLMADIDLSAYTGTKFPLIGKKDEPFNGVFNGNEHYISNFRYDTNSTDVNYTDYIGLFGFIGYSGQINNLGLDVDIDVPNGNFVGGLAGYNKGTITDCGTSGSVSGKSAVGGILGANCGQVGYCSTTAHVSGGGNRVGGLAGENNGGTIIESYTAGSVLGFLYSTGGLLGANLSGSVIKCFSESSADGDANVGGLVGLNTSQIMDCYAIGNVGANNRVGGLVGYNTATADCNGTIVNCYSAGYVFGNADAGGLVGVKDAGTVTASFWNTETSWQSTSAGGTGKTTDQMKMQSTFTGWDFTNVWYIVEGTTYPFFIWWEEINLGSSANFYDFAILAGRWTQTGCNELNGYCQGADLDRSGAVDTQDLMMLSENWLR